MKKYNANGLRIGLLYNLRKDFEKNINHPNDIDADWDVVETIENLKASLFTLGCKVVDIKDPLLIMKSSIRNSIDVVFNICEMSNGSFRESLVPSLCEINEIPYFLSKPSTLINSLDKNIANLLALQNNIPVKPWVVVKKDSDLYKIDELKNYPYILKPAYGGSSMGVKEDSIVFDSLNIKSKVLNIISNYNQPVLIQEYMSGREFTVGVYEKNGVIHGLEPIEIIPTNNRLKNFIYSYQAKENSYIEVIYQPIKGEKKLKCDLINIAIKSHVCFECRDISRTDIRLDSKNNPYFIEINPLPHMHPDISDFFRSSKASDISYLSILENIIDNFNTRKLNE